MSGALTNVGALFQIGSIDPATAAAVTLLSENPPPLPLGHLEAALKAVAPRLTNQDREGWVRILAVALCNAAITAPRCVAALLGQCAVESDGFRSLEEDLNYSAARLCEVWPSRFPDLDAASACAMQPERLANTVYANRMGNRDAASGDGWRFRGRGLIQITGRAAYERFARAMGMTLDQAVEHAGTNQGAVESATWFWSANELNGLAKTWSLSLMTRKINGGIEDEAERARLCEAALHAIGAC